MKEKKVVNPKPIKPKKQTKDTVNAQKVDNNISSQKEQAQNQIAPVNNEYNFDTIELDFDNEVYDEGDIASALEMGYITQALQAHKAKTAKETHPDFDGETCIECGDDIPKIRLEMGKIRCVHCQELLEKKNKLNNR